MKHKQIIQHGPFIDTYNYKALIENQANTELDKIDLNQSKQKAKTKILKKLPKKMERNK